MQKVEQYICEVCGTEYKDKSICEQCETGHIKPVEIKSAKFYPVGKGNRYPVSVSIEMDNGEIAVYRS